MHPLQRSSRDSAHNNPTTLILWVCTPSIPRFSDHRALRHTKSLRFSDPPPCPPSLFSCTSPSWSVWPLTGLVVLCLGFEPGRHSSVGNTLTIQRFLLSGSMTRLVRPVYIGAVVNAREILLQLKRPFFVTKKFFFKSLWRAHARKEEGKLCGEVVKTRCETIRHNGPVFIWCIKSIYNVETMNLQLFER